MKKNKWVEFALCVSLGYFGIHRFYAKRQYAQLWLWTFGLCGIGWIVDSIVLLVQALKAQRQSSTVASQTSNNSKASAAQDWKRKSWQEIHAERANHFQKLLDINRENVRCLDIETTGLDKNADEVLQLSIIDGNGKILFNDYIKPTYKTQWPEAARINHITCEMVADKQTIEELLPEINRVMSGAELIVGYNSERFDIPFLKNKGVAFPDDAEQADVMRLFAIIYGEKDTYRGGYRWQKLTTCANYYGYQFNAHDSLEDIKATLFCFYKIAEKYASERE